MVLFVILAGGCSRTGAVEPEDSSYHINYMDKENTKIVEVAYEPKGGTQQEQIEEFLDVLGSDSGSVDYKKPIPDQVEVLKYNIDKDQLSIYFSKEYAELDPITEVLLRAAVVRTLTQIDGIQYISFFIQDTPLKDSTGAVVGVMTKDSFIENPGEQINSIQNTTLTLYFANKAGDALCKEERQVHYSSNISVEKLVVEQLLAGPEEKGHQGTIPEGTHLVSVTVSEGVCYVNLDEGFLNQNYSISENVVIYSIVNSLSELSTVSRVQISVNGDTSGVYRDKMELASMYERNLDVLETEASADTTDSSKQTSEEKSHE